MDSKKVEKLALSGGPKAITGDIPEYKSIGTEEIEAANRVMRSGKLSQFFGSWGENFLGGPEVRSMESAWCEAFDIPYSISMNSATSGLIASVGACGIGPGDEVIVSPFTMTSSASCVRVWGGTPVFADVDSETFNMAPSSIESCITPKTRAIIVVDLAGQPADMAEIMSIARTHNLWVIEDAAQAPGATYRGNWAGTLGDIGVFSLNCHKTIQTGEGGVCCTRNAKLATRLQLIRNHGEDVVTDMGFSDRPETILGFNFRLGEIEAAMATEQLKKLQTLNEPRQQIALELNRRLSKLDGLFVPETKSDRTHVYYIHMLRIDERLAGVSRRQVVQALEAEGIDCFEGYCRPLYLQPLYKAAWPGKDNREYGPGLCPVAESLYESEVFFHSYLYEAIKSPWLDQICCAFEKVWSNRRELAEVDDVGARAIRRA